MTENKFNFDLKTAIPVIILFALFIIAGLLPIDSMWGFNHLKYFSPMIAVIYSVLFLIILIPHGNKLVYNVSADIKRNFSAYPRPVQAVIIIIVSGAVLYLLRVHVHSLGDGYQRIYQIEQGYLYYNVEVLDFFTHGVIYRFFKLFGIDSGELAYTVTSIMTGIIFVLIVILTKIPEKIFGHSSAAKILILSLGSSLLFFGYVESYSLYYPFALLYIIFAFKFIREKTGLLAASIFLALAQASHMTGIIFLPSFLWLLWNNFDSEKSNRNLLVPFLIAVIPFLGIIIQEIYLRTFIAEVMPSVSGGILPLYSSEKYSILSPQHLWDILNEILLIFPAVLILFIYSFLIKPKTKRTDGRIFAIIVTVCAFIFMLLIDPKLGYARDWDLFATATASIGAVTALYLFSRYDINKYSITVISFTSVLFFSSWAIMNAADERQLERAEDLLKLSDKGRGYGTELLAHYYRNVLDDPDKAAELLSGDEGVEKNARVYAKLVKTHLDKNKFAEAWKAVQQGLKVDSGYAELHYLGAVALTGLNRLKEALPYINNATQMDPGRMEIWHTKGVIHYRLLQYSQAIEAFKRSLEIRPDYSVANYEIANMYRLLGKYDSALIYVKKGLQANPNYPGGVKLLEMIEKEARN